MKHLLFLFFVGLSIISCQERDNNDNTTDSKRMWEPVDSYIEGTYEGDLPCDDCKERQIKLKLDMDRSAIATIARVGENESATTSIGNWELRDDIIIVSFSNSEDLYFQATPDQLIEMDSATKKRSAKQSDKYSLDKQN